MERKPDADRVTRRLTLAVNTGILVGILLLVVELSQLREMMRSQTRHDLAMAMVQMQLAAAADGELADIMRRAAIGETLTPTETVRHRLRLNAVLRSWEDVLFQHRLGVYSDSEFATHKEVWRRYLNSAQHFLNYWCQTKDRFSDDFRRELDSLLTHQSCP